MGFEDQIAEWFLHIAYQPMLVYGLVIGLMFASSFGFPLPEEVTIISASLTAFMATHPTATLRLTRELLELTHTL